MLTAYFATIKTINHRHNIIKFIIIVIKTAHLRHRTHNRQLAAHHGHLADCNFITRLLYKDTY